MTQRILKAAIDGRAVDVQMGWDRPLPCYYLVVDYPDSECDEPLYSNLNDPATARDGSLSHLVANAKTLGLTLPDAMIARVAADAAADLGNAESFFDDAGVELRL